MHKIISLKVYDKMNLYRFLCHKKAIYIFKNVNYLFGVSDENFGVSGMVAAGVSGGTGSAFFLHSNQSKPKLNK